MQQHYQVTIITALKNEEADTVRSQLSEGAESSVSLAGGPFFPELCYHLHEQHTTVEEEEEHALSQLLARAEISSGQSTRHHVVQPRSQGRASSGPHFSIAERAIGGVGLAPITAGPSPAPSGGQPSPWWPSTRRLATPVAFPDTAPGW